jgi:hypothetical protein
LPLTPGVRLGPYKIASAIGAGGMGEVYKARDARLAERPGALFRSGDRMMVADVDIGAAIHIGKPRELFSGHFVPAGRHPNYAVTPDGQRFVMIRTRNDNARRSEIQIVLNWLEELKARVPIK